MKIDEHSELKRKPINKEKYVRDKVRYGSKNKAVRIQKPFYGPATNSQVVKRLEADPVVQELSQGIMAKLVDLNAKRLFVIDKTMDSEDEKTALAGAEAAGKVVSQFQDRTLGRARQTVEMKSTKVEIKLDLSGGAVTAPREVNLIEGEESDGFDS